MEIQNIEKDQANRVILSMERTINIFLFNYNNLKNIQNRIFTLNKHTCIANSAPSFTLK